MIMNKTKIYSVFILLLFVLSCTTFVTQEDQLKMENTYENKIFILKKDVDRTLNLGLKNDSGYSRKGVSTLKKGSEVFLDLYFYNSSGYDAQRYIKVYIYPNIGEEPFLKQERFLLFFVFEEDYRNKNENKEFNLEDFDKMLSEWVEPKSSEARK